MLTIVRSCFTLAVVVSCLCSSGAAGQITDAAPASEPSRVFLCIYADHLESSANSWVKYRSTTGWDSRSVAVSTIIDEHAVRTADWEQRRLSQSNTSAMAIQGYIRKVFQKAQKAEGIKGGWFAVLLLGDVNGPKDISPQSVSLPTFYFPKSSDPQLQGWFEGNDVATDHPYQLADDDDQLPDFLVGRVPAQTNDDAMTLLAKVRTYEQQPGPGDWRNRITYIASEGRFGPVDKLIEQMFVAMVEEVVPYEYDISMTYGNAASPYCAPPSKFNATVLERLNDGALLVNYTGHGAPNSLDVLRWNGERFPICSLDDARNGLDIAPSQAPFLVIIACSTGAFDREHGQMSLSEAMLFNPRGPIAIVSGSRVTHPYPNAMYQKFLTDEMCSEHRPTIGSVDVMATRHLVHLPSEADRQMERLASLLALQGGWETAPPAHRVHHASLYNVLGDPATSISHVEHSVESFSYDGTSRTVTGVVPLGDGSPDLFRVQITLESPRSVIPRQDELIRVQGRNDPDLESKAAHNYPIANDFILDQVEVPLGLGGSFVAQFDYDLPMRTPAWIKVKVYRLPMPRETDSADTIARSSGFLYAVSAFRVDVE